jgi:hypothetical protein
VISRKSGRINQTPRGANARAMQSVQTAVVNNLEAFDYVERIVADSIFP